ncbi:hypothetical protein F9278_09655 [Streptomyces phaeolivaceus]|uniref:CU044_5270 family protein n=1 Tax=Streptomyces phaeolivaceus TaxID=2653200 RepID=A0A5P8K077_9ACTN|nr:CU044_5270 family protein [Streptomyces phaeolivaceus]QFQ96426.1 hypothetical protein F9278_09655 [Streptomyces phaeolivaceus]
MDELTEVRQLRSGASAPDRARLAPGRARLLDAAWAGERRRRRWARREFVLAGVVAAVTTVAVTASLLEGLDGPSPNGKPAALTGADLKGMTPAELLERAAEAVEGQPAVPEPRADQWIYRKSTLEAPDEEEVQVTGVTAVSQEIWTRYDGGAAAQGWRSTEDGSLRLRTTETRQGAQGEGDNRSPRELYRFLTTLPSDGEDALEAIREEDALPAEKGSTQVEQDHAEISALLDADIKPSKGLAGLYRALATLPDLALADHLVEDGTGRRVIALSEGTAPDRYRLIDPETYDVLGTQDIRGGKVIGGSSLITSAVVDAAGERG